MDFEAHLLRAMAFSHATFGPGKRTKGVIDHIRKELVEIEADHKTTKSASDEWVDVLILAIDGLARSITYNKEGHDAERFDPEGAAAIFVHSLLRKQRINESRTWPDWRRSSPDKAIEHDRSGE